MLYLRPSSEEEMICEFLKAELNSHRFEDEILNAIENHHISRQIIENPDLSDPDKNAHRKRILADYRQYGKNEGLFENFPDVKRWCWERLERDDIQRIKYINYSYWNDLSGGTGSPLAAAENIKSGITSCGVPNDGFFMAARALEDGQSFAPMIFLRTPDASLCIMLEGHVRLTAYALSGRGVEGLECITGFCTSDELSKWDGG